MGRPVANSTGPGTADADAPDRDREVLRGVLELGEQLLDAAEHDLGSIGDVRGLRVMAEDAPVEIGDRDVDARRPEVSDQDLAGIRLERELAGRTATRAGTDVALGDEPAVQQLLHPAGDDRPPEAGPRHELRAGPRPAQPDLVEDDDERVEHLVRERIQGPLIRRPFELLHGTHATSR